MFPSHRRSRRSSRRHFEPVRLSHTHSSSAAHCAGAASPPLLRLSSPPPTPLQGSLRFLPLSRPHVNAHASLSLTRTLRRRAHARMRRPLNARAPRRRRGSPPPLASGCRPSRRPTAPAPRRPPSWARARPAARACAQATDPPPRAPSPPQRPRSNTDTDTLRLCDPAPPWPAAPAALPHLSWEGGDPDPPQSTTSPQQWAKAPRSHEMALYPSEPVTVTQPEGRTAWAGLKAGSPGVRPLGPADPTWVPHSGLPRARGCKEGTPSCQLPSPRASRWAKANLPAIPRQAPAPPPRGPSAFGLGGSSVQRPGPASPTPRRSEGAGNGNSMSVLVSAPRGGSRRLTRASTGTRRGIGLRDGPGAAAAGAPTAGRRRPGRWPWKPPLLGHAQVSAAPVPPAARVGRDPAPGESGRPPRRGERAVPSPQAGLAAPGRGRRWRPGREDVSSRCTQLRARVSDGAAAARGVPALPTNRLPRLDSCPTG